MEGGPGFTLQVPGFHRGHLVPPSTMPRGSSPPFPTAQRRRTRPRKVTWLICEPHSCCSNSSSWLQDHSSFLCDATTLPSRPLTAQTLAMSPSCLQGACHSSRPPAIGGALKMGWGHRELCAPQRHLEGGSPNLMPQLGTRGVGRVARPDRMFTCSGQLVPHTEGPNMVQTGPGAILSCLSAVG